MGTGDRTEVPDDEPRQSKAVERYAAANPPRNRLERRQAMVRKPPRSTAWAPDEPPDFHLHAHGFRASSDWHFYRRSAGVADETQQGDGFVLDGVAASTWFASLDLPSDAPGEVQERVARLLTQAIEADAEQSMVHASMESVPPHTAMLFMRTNVYIRLKEIKRLKVSVLAGLLTDAITHSPPVAIGATAAVTLWDNIKRLSDQEVEVIHTMQRLTDGHAYSQWLPFAEIDSALPDDGDEQRVVKLLAGLKSKGILEEGAGLWRVVR